MTSAFRQGSVVTEVGPGSIIHAFFSTVSSNLEPAGWGSRFPYLMNALYQGKLRPEDARAALNEINVVADALKILPIDKLIWNIERPTDRPPRSYDETCDKSSIYTYFRTVSGRNLVAEIKDNIESQVEFGGPLEIISYESISDIIR